MCNCFDQDSREDFCWLSHFLLFQQQRPRKEYLLSLPLFLPWPLGHVGGSATYRGLLWPEFGAICVHLAIRDLADQTSYSGSRAMPG